MIETICGDATDPVKRELEEQRAKKAANGRELKSRSLWIADRKATERRQRRSKPSKLCANNFRIRRGRAVGLGEISTGLLTEWKGPWPTKRNLQLRRNFATWGLLQRLGRPGWLEASPAEGLEQADRPRAGLSRQLDPLFSCSLLLSPPTRTQRGNSAAGLCPISADVSGVARSGLALPTARLACIGDDANRGFEKISFVMSRLHRLDQRCSVGWSPACQHADSKQKQRRSRERSWLGRL